MRLTTAALGLALGLVAAPTAAQRPADEPSQQAMLVAEDSRARSPEGLEPLFRGLLSRDPAIVSQAIRAIGRFERPSLLPRILPFLADARPQVRLATVHAIGQIAQDTGAASSTAPVLIDRLPDEQDPEVLGSLARSIGRLPYRSVDRARAAEAALARLAVRPLPASALVEVARGMEAFVRRGGLVAPQPDFLIRLKTLATYTDADAGSAARVRRAAVAALVGTAPPEDRILARLAGDEDDEVRRQGVIWAGDSTAIEARRGYLALALLDRSPAVRLEALRIWSRRFQTSDCDPIVRAVQDPVHLVGLEAISLLGRTCPAATKASEVLWPIVDSLAGSQPRDFIGIVNWHRGATALVALARVDPIRAKTVLARTGASPIWQVRMYSARAAGIIGDPGRLVTLGEDGHDNVREAAIAGLLRVQGHAADSIFREDLARTDYQLVIAAAKALAGTPHPASATVALVAALDRITTDQTDTSRDPRLALLERLDEVGTGANAGALEPYLQDFDPAVAERAATILTKWTNRPRQAAPKPLPPPALNAAAIARLRGAVLRVTMQATSGGGQFEIALDPDLAPVTVARLAVRAADGYYDGLTFHRVVANFVIQGGSPRANEYAGDARYLRDEVGPLSHERGTVGISTRGRDTGDAQFFVNLVDNLRLDFDYTVFGRITSGMEVVDAILEGDVIDRIDLVGGTTTR